MFNYITAGESHGPQLTAILEGIPAGLKLDVSEINQALADRQGGYGRGNRQKIEKDTVEIVGGVRHQVTLGGPIALVIKNRDHSHWGEIMDPYAKEDEKNTLRKVEWPRPGHADLVGGMKYGHRDLRNVLERSSARETAIRVAIGNICKQFLKQLEIDIVGYVQRIGGIDAMGTQSVDVKKIEEKIKQNDLRILESDKVDEIHNFIDETKKNGDTVGGLIRIVATNIPAGLGSYINWDTKLDAKIAMAIMGMNAIKGVSFGDGFDVTKKKGSEIMDEIRWKNGEGWSRYSNHLGGFEGGMTNGMPIIVNAALKPIPTLYKPLRTVDINTKETHKANVERSDTTAIVPGSIVAENIVSIELARTIIETFESSNMQRLQAEIQRYRAELKGY